MRLTNKQNSEIDFLFMLLNKKGDMVKFTDSEIEEYISCTVHGRKKEDHAGKFEKNRLFQMKRGLDILIKMWRAGVREKTISKDELIDDFDNKYIKKIIKQL